MHRTLNSTLVALATLVLVAACGSSSAPRLTRPATLAVAAAAPATATVGTSVTPVPVFVVKDSGGRALPNVALSFIATSGSIVTPTSVVTDANGRAAPSAWILRHGAGTVALVANLLPGPLSATAAIVAIAGPPTTLRISPSSVTLGLTDTATLSSLLSDAFQNQVTTGAVTYVSSNTAVATISGNRVIAHASGNATITATATGTTLSATVPVTVIERFGHLSGRPFGIAYVAGQPGSILVSSLDVNALLLVNASSYAVRSTVPVSTTPSDVVANGQGTIAYVSAVDGSEVAAVNVASGTRQPGFTDFGAARVLLSPDGSLLYVGRNGGLDAFSIASGARTASLTIGVQVNGLAISSDGSTLWASERFSGKVYRLKTATMTITDSVTTGGAPQDIQFHSASGNIYVANEFGWVDALNGGSLAAVSRFSGTPGAFGMRLTPDETKLYVSGSQAGQVYVLDRITGSVIRTVSVGGVPRRITFLPDGRTAIANEAGWVDLVP